MKSTAPPELCAAVNPCTASAEREEGVGIAVKPERNPNDLFFTGCVVSSAI